MIVPNRLDRLPRRPARPVAVACIVGLLVASVGAAAMNNPASKCDSFISRQMASRPTSGWTSVIVRLNRAPGPEHASHLKALGCDVYRHLPSIDSLAVRVPVRNLARLANLPIVRRLSADAPVRKLDVFTVDHSGADAAWQQYRLTGSGVNVAIVDSGVRPCRDLGDPGLSGETRIVKSVGFVPGTRTSDDACGHGTHVAGIVAGNGAASSTQGCFVTFDGIAPSAGIVDVRVLNGLGRGTVSSVAAGIQWVIAHRADYRIRILNLSLGHDVSESYTTDPLCQAVEAAWKAGIVVVCAAGNDGRLGSTQLAGQDNEGWGTAYGSIQSPANDPYVITVGATKQTDGQRATDRIATYSSRGPSRLDLVLKPDIVAPGNRVISLMASHSYLATNYRATNAVSWAEYYHPTSLRADLRGVSNKYFRLSGTSMAAPVVAGAAALMLQADPTLTPDTVKARLMVSADKWASAAGDAPDPCTVGAGYLNIPAALRCTVVAGGPALSPTLTSTDDGSVCIEGRSICCGEQGFWGAGIGYLEAIWGNRIIWGQDTVLSASLAPSSRVSFDRIIWGTDTGVDLSAIAINGED